MKFIKIHKLKLLFLLYSSPIILLFYSNYAIEKASKSRTFYDIKKIPKNKVGLVLGTIKTLENGSLNYYFKYRIDATVKLYKSKKIDFILVSGDNGNKNYDEPSDFLNALIRKGIPRNKIFLDYAGFRTLDSIIRSKEIFGQKKITFISQEFHNKRAIYLAQNHGIEALGFNAKDISIKYSFRTKIREQFAKSKAVLDILFNVKPKFLGKKITIK